LDRNLPIGIFDSGVGGLTVYKALHERLPNERFVYLGDTARVPYGTKSLATVERYAVENSRFLETHGIKLLEIAQDKRIGVIATEATVQSHAYAKAIAAMGARGEVVERACPLFVPLAEEGWADSDVARTVARDYLHDFTETPPAALVLGCTHYPILRGVISDTVGREVKLIDSGAATARDVESLLESSDLTHEDALDLYQERQLCDDLDHFYVTDAAERFAKVAERFLGSAPSILEAVEIWGHDELRTY
jgi:glutamate racemase